MAYTPGPFDSPHLYMQWGGALPGNEEWSCGLRFYTEGNDPVAGAADLLDDYATAVVAYHADVAVSPRALLQFVKVNAIDVDGHYISQNTNEQVMANVPGGGVSTVNVPNQIALAVSLTTGYARGPAHRGRFFLPMPTASVDATGLVAAANADLVATKTMTFINALNAVTANFQVGVFSRKLGVAGHRRVTGVQVGRVLDTQRRRRRSLVEDYQS